MSDRYLKHLPSGNIFIWQQVFATNPEFVEVADAQGSELPEALEGEYAVVDGDPVSKAKSRKKKAVGLTVDPTDDLVIDDAVAAQQALDADASRGV